MKMHYRKKACSCFLAFLMLLPLLTMSRVNAQEITPGTIVDSDGLNVVMTIDSQWPGFCNGTIAITNTGADTIHDFAYSFDFPYEITNIWNASILEHANGVYTVKNLGWNQDIAAGTTASIGFTAAIGEEITLPTFFVLNTKEADVPAEAVKVEYFCYSDWGTGFSGAIRVTNQSTTPIEDYRLDLNFAREITSISNAEILSHEGSGYSLQNSSYSQNIAPGQTVEIGINGTGGTSTDTITSYSVHQIGARFDLVSDTDKDTYADWLEICVRGTDPLIPEGTTPTPTPVEPTPTPPEATPTPTPPIEYDTDTDGDLLPDIDEIIIGTDPENTDTDNDGLSDYEEVWYLGYNPLIPDTDGDGALDFDEDVDQDGLSFREETEAGTNAYSWDTDGDQLFDGEELHTIFSEPLVADTDEDGLSDGDEILLDFDPLVSDTDGDGELDSKEKVPQIIRQEIVEEERPEVNEVSISMTIEGNIQKNVHIDNTYQIDSDTSNVVGLIGAPVEIFSDAAFKEAVITFSYDEALLGDTAEEDLAMMWYDEVNDEYIILEDAVVDSVNNTVSYTTTHFSTYLLVDKKIWFTTWRENLDAMAKARSNAYATLPLPNYDFVFAYQSNMSQQNMNQSFAISTKFIDTAKSLDRCAFLFFGEQVGLVTLHRSENFSKLKSMLKYMTDAEYLSFYLGEQKYESPHYNQAIYGANYIYWSSQIAPDNLNNQKILIIFGDGNNISLTGGDAPWTTQNYWPTVYTVRFGMNSVSDSILQSFAKDRGGELLIPDDTQDVFALFYEAAKTKLYEQENTKDTDSDGVSDIIEICGVLLSNGQIVYTDPLVADTDADGLSDGAEVGNPVSVSSLQQYEQLLVSQAGWDADTTYSYCFKFSSNPKMKDTDGDSYSDYIEINTYNSDPKHRDVKIIDLNNEYVTMEYTGTELLGNSYGWAPNQDSFGGNQNFFYAKDAYPNCTTQDYNIGKHGCGLISASDIFLYLATSNSNYSTVFTDMAIDSNSGAIVYDNYRTYIRNINLAYFPITLVHGIPPVNLADGINTYAYYHSINLNAQWYYPGGSMLEGIEDMLENNLPVPLVVSDYENQGVLLYNWTPLADDTYNFTRSDYGPISGHYFTITSIIEDDIKRRTMLEVSTWGVKYYLDFEEYLSFIADYSNYMISNIVYIEMSQ